MHSHAHAEARDGLIGWLPEELVLFHVLPRLPWYTRPVCRAISKSWRALIDSCKTKRAAELELKTRQYQLPLLRGLFLICTFDNQVFITRGSVSDERKGATYYAVEWLSDPIASEWRKFDKFLMHKQFRSLPPLEHLLPSCYGVEGRLMASSGRVYVWFDDEKPDFVLKMDMGCGDWTWNKIVVPHLFHNSDAVDFNGKIYMPTKESNLLQESASQEERDVVLVYDMMTDLWKLVETWSCQNLRVLQKKSSCLASAFDEELYSFTERQSVPNRRIEVSVYNASQDSWRVYADIPIRESLWPLLWQVQLLNGDCFEPASKRSTNIVWISNGTMEIASFDPSDLFLLDYNPKVEGKHLEYLQIVRGSLYGIFVEGKDIKANIKFKYQGEEERDSENGEEEEERGWGWDERLWKRTIRKGKICVARSIVEWEEVHEIGFFEESWEMGGLAVLHFTSMA